MTTNRQQTPKRITIPENEWPMHDWPADEIVVAGIVTALEGCSMDDDKTRVAVVDAYGQEMPILGIRVRPGSKHGVLEIVTDTPDVPAVTSPAPADESRSGADPEVSYNKRTVTGTVTSIRRHTTRDKSVYLTVYVDGRAVKYLQTGQEIPRRGQQVEIKGVPIIGRLSANMGAVEVRVLSSSVYLDALRNRLPVTAAALDVGTLDMGQVRLIAAETAVLTDEQAQAAEAAIAGRWDGLTWGELRDLVTAAVINMAST